MAEDFSAYTLEALALVKEIQRLARDKRGLDAAIVALKLAKCALDMAKVLRSA